MGADDDVNGVGNTGDSSELVSADESLAPALIEEIAPVILTSRIMQFGYAACMVVLSVGLVGLVIELATLCFFNPQKCDTFAMWLGGPLAALLVMYSKPARRVLLKALIHAVKDNGK